MCRMENSNFDDTIPTTPVAQPGGESPDVNPPGDTLETGNTDEPVSAAPENKKRTRWGRITLLGILILVAVFLLSAGVGYASGIKDRRNAEVTLRSAQANEQFTLAEQDIANHQYNRALQRLEYIASIDSNYPGILEKLAEVQTMLRATATPPPAPTAASTPIIPQDTSDLDALFNQAAQAQLNGDWAGAIDTLLILRKTDPSYNPVAIDGILFLALRNRGIDKALKQADLEGGMYDLTLASRFGPLDSEALGYMNWVSLYSIGASFWELDWEKVVEYFTDVANAFPGLTDRSGMSARERLRLGLMNLGIQMMNQGDACGAITILESSLAIGADEESQQAYNQAQESCNAEVQPEIPPVEVTTEPTSEVIVPLPTDQPPIGETPYPSPSP